MFSMKCRNNIAVQNNKKSMKIADFINIHTNIYTYIICEYESKKKRYRLNTAAWSCC